MIKPQPVQNWSFMSHRCCFFPTSAWCLQSPTSTALTSLIWAMGITDFVLKYFTMGLKDFTLFLPKILRAFTSMVRACVWVCYIHNVFSGVLRVTACVCFIFIKVSLMSWGSQCGSVCVCVCVCWFWCLIHAKVLFITRCGDRKSVYLSVSVYLLVFYLRAGFACWGHRVYFDSADKQANQRVRLLPLSSFLPGGGCRGEVILPWDWTITAVCAPTPPRLLGYPRHATTKPTDQPTPTFPTTLCPNQTLSWNRPKWPTFSRWSHGHTSANHSASCFFFHPRKDWFNDLTSTNMQVGTSGGLQKKTGQTLVHWLTVFCGGL